MGHHLPSHQEAMVAVLLAWGLSGLNEYIASRELLCRQTKAGVDTANRIRSRIAFQGFMEAPFQ